MIYSLTHATQLPEVISSALLMTAQAVCRSQVSAIDAAHARTFLEGLASHGMRVQISRVDSAWVAAVVALGAQPGKGR